jgi:hypothetical protein
MPRRKTSDPKLLALLDQRRTITLEFERWYTRMRRALAHMERARQRLKRLAQRIEAYEADGTRPGPGEG